MKLSNIDKEDLQMSYDNIKSHKKAELSPFSRKYSFGKTTGNGGGQIHPPAFLELSQIERGVQNGPISKNGVLSVTTLFF